MKHARSSRYSAALHLPPQQPRRIGVMIALPEGDPELKKNGSRRSGNGSGSGQTEAQHYDGTARSLARWSSREPPFNGTRAE
jgi:hypothetical protein